VQPRVTHTYTYVYVCVYIYICVRTSPMVQQPLMGQGLLISEASHSYTPTLVGLLWTSDQPDAETST
jgi:hypothetical protein